MLGHSISFPAFHGARRFNSEFTRALHLFLSLARPAYFMKIDKEEAFVSIAMFIPLFEIGF
jgi:hypothetical protein